MIPAENQGSVTKEEAWIVGKQIITCALCETDSEDVQDPKGVEERAFGKG